jgi:hypothetical protein
MSEEVIDPNMEIEGTNDMGGFELPPEGNIENGTGKVMVFTGEIKECGKDKKSLGFELGWDGDLSQKARIFIKTTSPQGLKRFVGLGTCSGVFKKINEKRIRAGKTPILSEKGGIKPKVLQAPNFHEQLRQEIEGCKILCTITHSKAKDWTDEEGVEHEGLPQANIKTIAPVGSVSKATKAATETVGAAGSDDDWDE